MMRRLASTLVALALAQFAVPADAAEPAASGVSVRAAWARATPPGMAVAAVYLTLAGGSQDDRLVGAETARAAMAQIHVVTEAAGMTRMRQTEGVDVPARATVELAPQGTHVMLMELRRPLVAGERFALTLQFEHAGRIGVDVEVRAQDAAPPAVH